MCVRYLQPRRSAGTRVVSTEVHRSDGEERVVVLEVKKDIRREVSRQNIVGVFYKDTTRYTC